MIDYFDALLNSRCSIWRKGGSGVVDDYGHESQAYTLLKEDVPCRVTPGGGKELQTQAAFGIQQFTVFMRPQTVDNPPVPLNIHHWIQINKSVGMDGTLRILVDPPSADGQQLLNITNIKDPGFLGHHIEIAASQIEP